MSIGPPVTSAHPLQAQGRQLVALAHFGGADGVVEVDTAEHGTLAVGVVDGVPFATGNICRHQFAKLGRGQIRDGCLECPWHRARYDVRSGEMLEGPKGRVWGFPPYSKGVQAAANAAYRLRTFDVALEDGWIVLRS